MTFRTIAAIAVTLLFWATAFAAIHHVIGFYEPGPMALLRFMFASVGLLLYALAARMRLPAREDLPGLFAIGFFGVPVYHLLLNFGQRTVPAGTAAFLISTSPVFTALIARFFLRERLKLAGWFGIAVSLSGIPLISLARSSNGFELDLNALLIVGSAMSAAVYVAMQKKYLEKYSALELTTYILCAGTLCLFFYLPGMIDAARSAPPTATLLVAYLGIFPGAIAYVTWAYVISQMPASRAVSFLYVVPPLATLFDWAVIGSDIRPIALAGGALALGGVVIVNRFGRV